MMLYIVRHGETDWNKAHKVQGRTDIPREFDSCIIKKLLTGRIKPVFFCQVFCFIA